MWNRQVAPRLYHMGLSCQVDFDEIVPGQFVMIQIDNGKGLLLRRPFSIFGILGSPDKPQGMELLYKVVGQGTNGLSKYAEGQFCDILGPLGRGFRLNNLKKNDRYYLTAGGIGVAPIRFLAQYMARLGFVPHQCHVFIGGQSRSDFICGDDFSNMGMPVTVTTDDGSLGDQCLITDPLREAVSANPPAALFACGPEGMLKCIGGIVDKYPFDCQLSMETMMACGIGACLGCAMEGRDPKKAYCHVCIDGPVFDARELKL
jgi:dihydroorotate dehydrogenase electron transfer subunit